MQEMDGSRRVFVALHLPKLRAHCIKCAGSDGIQLKCDLCDDRGWVPVRNIRDIIMNIEYPFTLVLRNDILGWMAEITLDGSSDDTDGSTSEAYKEPVEALYNALYRSLIPRIDHNQPRRRRTRGKGRKIQFMASEWGYA